MHDFPLVFVGARGTVHAFDAASGARRWVFELFRPSLGKEGYTEVRLVGPRLIVAGGGAIAVLDALSGTLLRKTRLSEHDYPPIALLVGAHGELFVTHDGALFALTPDGQPLWSQVVTPNHSMTMTLAASGGARF